MLGMVLAAVHLSEGCGRALEICGQVEQLLLGLVSQCEVLVVLGQSSSAVVDWMKVERERLTVVLVSWKPGVVAWGVALDMAIRLKFLILKIDLYVIGCFLELHFSVVVMVVVGFLLKEG